MMNVIPVTCHQNPIRYMYIRFHYYYRIDNSVDGLLFLEGIISTVVSDSALTQLIRNISVWNLPLLNNATLALFWHSGLLDPLNFLIIIKFTIKMGHVYDIRYPRRNVGNMELMIGSVHFQNLKETGTA